MKKQRDSDKMDKQKNIIIGSTLGPIQCKLWGAKTDNEAWDLVEGICVRTAKTKQK